MSRYRGGGFGGRVAHHGGGGHGTHIPTEQTAAYWIM